MKKKPINLGKVASSESDNVACQRNELEALGAIYGEDFSLLPVSLVVPAQKKEKPTQVVSPALRGSSGLFDVLAQEDEEEEQELPPQEPPLSSSPSALRNAGPPFHVRIYLRPFPADPAANHVAVHFHAIISSQYPDEVPTIRVTNVLGMPKAQIEVLEEQLRTLALELRGSEMIYQLTELAVNYLFDHNQPLQKGSLHDQMIDFEKEQKKSEAIGHHTRKDRERQKHKLRQKRLKAMVDHHLENQTNQSQDEDGLGDSENLWSDRSKNGNRHRPSDEEDLTPKKRQHTPQKHISPEKARQQQQLQQLQQQQQQQQQITPQKLTFSPERRKRTAVRTRSENSNTTSEREEDKEERELGDDDDDDVDDDILSGSSGFIDDDEGDDEGDGDYSDDVPSESSGGIIQLPSPTPVELDLTPLRTRCSSFRENAEPADVFGSSKLFPSASSPVASSSSLLGALSATRMAATSTTTTTPSSTILGFTATTVPPTVLPTVPAAPTTTSAAAANLAKPAPSHKFFRSHPGSESDEEASGSEDEADEDESEMSEASTDLFNEFRHPLDLNYLLGPKSKKDPFSTTAGNKRAPAAAASKKASSSKTADSMLMQKTGKPATTAVSSEEEEESEEGDEGEEADEDDYLQEFTTPLNTDSLFSFKQEVRRPAKKAANKPLVQSKQIETSSDKATKTEISANQLSSILPPPIMIPKPKHPPQPPRAQDKKQKQKTKKLSSSEENEDQLALLEEFSAPLDLARLKGLGPKPQNKFPIPAPVKKTRLSQEEEEEEQGQVDDEYQSYVEDFAFRKPKQKATAQPANKGANKKAAAPAASTTTTTTATATTAATAPANPAATAAATDAAAKREEFKAKVRAAKAQEEEAFLEMDESRYRSGLARMNPRKKSGTAETGLLDRQPSWESRYEHNFEEIETLGKGGFGVVVKARNKLDGAFYAIKKMAVDQTDKEVLREVVALAALHHNHIVRYYGAWYEAMTPELLKQLPLGDESGQSEETTYTSGPGGPPNSVLYIQMEFCSGRTLKDFINESRTVDAFTKPRQKKMIWTLFRQILEALAFIHSKHMLHRDIKPENVFLDATGSVKLGDFGLVVGDTATNAAKQMPVLQRQSSYISGIMDSHPEHTLEIGTMMYSAPEQIGAHPGGYGPPADIYSLGIVLLEMWQPFGSASEKAGCVAELRRTESVPDTCGVFFVPSKGRELRDRTRVKHIIESLVKHDPHARPTADALLAGKIVPVLIDHPHFKTALRALEQPESNLRLKILHQLFNLPVEDHVDYTFDHHSYKHVQTPRLESETLMIWREFMSRVFRKHGAQWFSSPLFLPKTQKVDISRKGPVVLLDRAGVPVQVCGHPTLAFARWVAKTKAVNVRRFEIGREFEATTDVCTAPIEHLVASFDIVWSHSETNTPVLDHKKLNSSEMLESIHEDAHLSPKPEESFAAYLQAEVFQVASEITGCLSSVLGPTTIYVNHTHLLESLIELCICVNNEEECARHRSMSSHQQPHHAEEEETNPTHQQQQHQLYDITHEHTQSNGGGGHTPHPKEETTKEFILRVLREQPHVSRQKLQDLLLNRTKTLPIDARKGFGEVVELLMTFLELKGPLSHVLEQLKEMTYVRTYLSSKRRHEGSTSLRAWMCELEQLCGALRAFGFDVDTAPAPKSESAERHVLLDLGFCPRYTVFQGIVLQVCHTPTTAASHSQLIGGCTQPLIVGGSYDHLLERFRPPDENHAPQSAMGLSVHIPRLLECCRTRKITGEALRKLIARSNVCTLPEDSECVVLFADKGKLLSERAMLASELWQRGVRAELQGDGGLRQALQYCQDHAIRYLVRFRVKAFAERQVVELLTAPFQSTSGVVLSLNDVISQITSQEGKNANAAASKSQAPANNRPTTSTLNQDIEIKMIGVATSTKNNAPLLTKIRKRLAPFLVMNSHRCVVGALDLSIAMIRGASFAWLQDRVIESQRSPYFGPTPGTPTRIRGKPGPSSSSVRPSSPKLVGVRAGRRGSDSNIIVMPGEKKSEGGTNFKSFLGQLANKEKAQLAKAFLAFLLSIPQGTEFVFTYSIEEDKLDMLAVT